MFIEAVSAEALTLHPVRGRRTAILLTFGAFYFLINVFMLYVTHWIVPEFEISSFWWAALAALIVSVVNGTLHRSFGRPGKPSARHRH